MIGFKNFIEAVATLDKVGAPPTNDIDDNGENDCEIDRKSLELWATNIGWKQVGGDFVETIMKNGRQLIYTKLEYITPISGNIGNKATTFGYKGLVESTVRWVYGSKDAQWQNFITEFKNQLLASSLWSKLQVNSSCIHEESFLWELLDIFTEIKSRMVELWRYENGHNQESIKKQLSETLKNSGIHAKSIELGKHKEKFREDKAYGGFASQKNNYISVKSVLWFPFTVEI